VRQAPAAVAAGGRRWQLPVVYGGAAGPDLAALAEAGGLSEAAAVAAHAGVEYVVYMLGFLPGFPFMGDVAAPLRQPRRAEPRLRVPAGSVAVANGLSAIYPWESPGGWHLLGRCPAPLFDPARTPPALLAAGDRVRFEPVTAQAMAGIEADLAAGRLDPQRWAVS
jgi:KipI family sensor histidine kinase inhibitor